MFRIHIVALRFCDVKNCLDEFLAEAQGRAMTLRPDPANDVDTKAICAYDWQGRHVGYVANYELKEAWQTLRGSGRQSLRGRIVEVNCEHHYVEFECKVETLGESDDLYPATAYLEWNYTGPRLKPTQEMATLDYMMDEINERLNEHETWSEEERCDFMALAMRFCELSRYDLSGEMSDFRRRLCLRLMEIDKEEFRELTEELKMACGRAGRESHGGKVLNYWMRLIAEPKTIKPLLVCSFENYSAGLIIIQTRIHQDLQVLLGVPDFFPGLYNVQAVTLPILQVHTLSYTTVQANPIKIYFFSFFYVSYSIFRLLFLSIHPLFILTF